MFYLATFYYTLEYSDFSPVVHRLTYGSQLPTTICVNITIEMDSKVEDLESFSVIAVSPDTSVVISRPEAIVSIIDADSE